MIIYIYYDIKIYLKTFRDMKRLSADADSLFDL